MAVRATVVPGLKFAVQVEGQLIPAGLLVIVPVPVMETVSWAGVAKDAPSCVSADNVNLHVRPLQAPLKPVKFWPAPGVAVNVTVAPRLKDAVHVDGQLMPPGALVSVPAPVKATDKVTVCASGTGADCCWRLEPPPPQDKSNRDKTNAGARRRWKRKRRNQRSAKPRTKTRYFMAGGAKGRVQGE